MKVREYATYEDYLAKQKRILRKRGIGPYFCDRVIGDICHWMNFRNMKIRNGVCHGARCGRECDSFLRRFQNSRILGTDLVPKSGKTARYKTVCEVIEHDFMERREDWVGLFDFVYSNSFDHVFDPIRALNVWLEQLSEIGRLFLQWVPGMEKGGDGVGVHVDECIGLAESCGAVDDIIFSRGVSRRCKGPVVIVVVKCR